MGGLRPRADFTIADAAKRLRPRMVLVVLTGMGSDGLEGAKAVKAAGGRVLVEAESTCTVYGMPRAVAEAGLADEILPLDELADAIAREAGAMTPDRHPPRTRLPATLKTDDFAPVRAVRRLCGVDLLAVQARPDGAPRAHLRPAPRHARPRRLRPAPEAPTRRSSTRSSTA